MGDSFSALSVPFPGGGAAPAFSWPTILAGIDGNGNAQALGCNPPVAASALLKAATIVAGNTVTIGTKTYTFRVTPALEGEVALGAADTNAMDNLQYAINGTGTQVTNHTCAAPHPSVNAPTRTGTVYLSVVANLPGGAGNLIGVSSSGATVLWYKKTIVAAAETEGAATVTLTGGLYASLANSWSFLNVTAAQTSRIKTGPGVLHGITVGTAAAGSIIAYDALTAVAPIIGTLKSSIGEGTYLFDCEFKVGLTIVTAAATLITVTYR